MCLLQARYQKLHMIGMILSTVCATDVTDFLHYVATVQQEESDRPLHDAMRAVHREMGAAAEPWEPWASTAGGEGRFRTAPSLVGQIGGYRSARVPDRV